ncbi:hypothetical protein BGZ54_005686, partial [Gamsiella multidivaricata]
MSSLQNDFDDELPLAQEEFSLSQYLIPRPQICDLKPDQRLLTLCPSLDGKHFFTPESGGTDDEKEELDQLLASCPRNKLQKYTAPPITEVPWPDHQKARQYFDSELASIQAQLAQLTHPIDKLMPDTLADDRYDDMQSDELLTFADQMRRLLQK